MRIETASAWMLAGLCLLIPGLAFYVFDVTESAGLLAALGVIYIGTGAVLVVMHDHHMAKRTRAGWE